MKYFNNIENKQGNMYKTLLNTWSPEQVTDNHILIGNVMRELNTTAKDSLKTIQEAVLETTNKLITLQNNEKALFKQIENTDMILEQLEKVENELRK